MKSGRTLRKTTLAAQDRIALEGQTGAYSAILTADPTLPPEQASPPHEPMFRIPPATGWLIALNILVHVVRQLLTPEQDDNVLNALAFDTSSLDGHDAVAALSLLSYQFLHQGWDHLAINMVSLLAFGAGVERPLGWPRYLIIYFLCGIGGALLEACFAVPGTELIGASASISGIFGALLIVWGVHRSGKRPMGLLPMALIWIAVMALSGITGLGAQGAPVAWIAHIGGFIAGIALGFIFKRSMKPTK